MSITKGAMLISNANAVGAELVNKLGGTGYKPVEWADAINLLGISNDDKASALASITEGTYTGDERGSIKYSNCNAVGSMLNKKFSTDRGFKPVEWESAISKLTPLAEGTVSGSVVSFSNGADEVPLKKCEVSLSASLDGYSAVDVVQTGKNLINGYIDYSITNKVVEPQFYKAGTYTFSCVRTTNLNGIYVRKTSVIDLSAEIIGSKYNTLTYTFTIAEDGYYLIQLYRNTSAPTWEDEPVTDVQLEVGSTATTYEPYQTPTTHTASLGRTIYGGTVDVVKGKGESTHANVKVSDLTWTKQTASGRDFFIAQVSDMKTGTPKDIDSVLPYGGEITVAAMADKSLASWTNSLRIYDTDITSVSELLEAYGNDGISYPLATPEDFTFDTVPIDSKLGTNTLWSEQGDTEVTYRKDSDIPDPPVQLLNMNNNENNNNEGV